MVRSPVATRAARPDDVPDLLDLWSEVLEVGGRAVRAISVAAPEDVARTITDMLDDEDCEVIVAERAGETVGMAMLCAASLGPLSNVVALQIHHLVVRRDHRRHGVGRALLAAASQHAEDNGLDSVVVRVYPGAREAHRFYARLGFAPVATARIAQVASLRRHLAGARRRPPLGMPRRRTGAVGTPVR